MSERRNLKVVDVRETLDSKLAYLPGGRDREGKPILVVDVPIYSSDESVADNKLEKLLAYLLSTFNDETKKNGISLIMDARKGSWRVARSYIQRSMNVVGKYAARMIVIRPDSFWEKRVDNCTKSWKDGEPIYISITRLYSYVDTAQVSSDLRGTKAYDHYDWIQMRVRVEDYEKSTAELISKLNEFKAKLKDFGKIDETNDEEKSVEFYVENRDELEVMCRYILHEGRILASDMSSETSQDIQDTIHRVHDLLDMIESNQIDVENSWTEMTTNLTLMKEIKDIEQGINRVTNWILGPADAMLNFHSNVGFDVASSEILRREHEELERECRVTYARYTQLTFRINKLPEHCLTESLKAQKDFMDFVCRGYATRLERRRNILITCQRFFCLVSEYFDKTSEVFDKMIMGNRACNSFEAEAKLMHLEASQSNLDGILQDLIREGEKFSELMSMPVKNALGRDVKVEYAEDITNVTDILDATNARKNIFNDSVELQKLTLKQTISICTYETDADQSIKWLSDLFNVLIKNYTEVGCSVTEIQKQKDDLQNFEEISQGAFEYGCQLLNGARILRTSCRLSLDTNVSLFSQLREAWRRIRSVSQEQLTRLRVCTIFHRSIDEHCRRLTDLIKIANNSLYLINQNKSSGSEDTLSDHSSSSECLKEVTENREKLLGYIDRTVKLGRLLTTSLKEPLCSESRMSTSKEDVCTTESRNLSAVEAISEKLAEVTRLAEKLDAKLDEAGVRVKFTKDEKDKIESIEFSSYRTASPSSLGTVIELPRKDSGVINNNGNYNEDDDHNDNEELLYEENKPQPNGINNNGVCDENTSCEYHKTNNDVQQVSASETEEINTEEYTTATECSLTPVARSRSDSFVTISECDDILSDLYRVEGVGNLEYHQVVDGLVTSETSGLVDQLKKMSKSPELIVDINQNVPDVKKTNATSIIETIEETSGKVVKEVTEVTTLRVSHDTKFGVASYKLTSNTLTENKEHRNAVGILDASHQYINGCYNGVHHDDKDASAQHSREEISISESEVPSKLENGHACRHSKIVKESTSEYKLKLPPDELKNVRFLDTKGNNDSGIEMPSKHNERLETSEEEEEEEDDNDNSEYFEKLKMSGEWLRLKVLEVYPELTRLGTTVDEAKRLSAAHDEVLVRLQSKQSPVEELLRQADQLISTQRPRAEVYAAMADTLGQAWRDVNSLLELQKQILDHNVLFKCRAEEFKVNAVALEKACTDTLLPIEIEVVKKFLTRIHDLRKAMLSSLMGALQEGRTLLDCLREIANEGTLDSRPDRIKADANNAVLQVEKWLEELHDQRTRIELSFTTRKTQLEQCLALALLATDLRDLEEIINDRMAALRASSDQLGDSSSSAGLLLFEFKKLQSEAKELQERSLKITKSTERLVSAKHFAGEQATAQAYVILESATDYVNELDQYEGLLNRAIAFFESARSAFTKLDQLEIQLATTEHPPHSPQLARFHAQTSATLTEVTSSPLAEGYALLDVTGRGAPGAEGVKRTVEELENRKIRLLERCTAHKEENLRISKGLAIFFEKYEELRSWLTGIADAFLRGHQDMGSDLPMAQDFYKMHCQLLEDLGKRGDEIDEALSVLSGTIMEITDERQRIAQKKHIEDRVDALRDSWLDCRHTVEARLHLSALYVDFHEAAIALGKELDEVESEFKKHSDNAEEGRIDDLEKRWNELRPLYMRLTSAGSAFLAEADRCTDAYLDILRARLCVETTLERFANRQLTVTESWENWQTSVVTTRERRIEQERRFEETTKTLAWATKFGEQLYPIITSESIKPSVILQDLESTQLGILPELKKAVTELDARIKSVESFTNGDDNVSERIKEKLSKVYEHLRTTATDYQNLLESLISIFDDLVQIENKMEEVNEIRKNLEQSSGFLTESGRDEVRMKAETINKIRDAITEVLKNVEPAIDQVISRIRTQEPAEAAVQETEKLNQVFNITSANWENACMEAKFKFDKRLLFCNFADDLDRIDADLMHLSDQLAGSAESGHRFTGDSLPAAEAASSAFLHFEKTVTILEERIKVFIKSTENNFELTTPESAPMINRELLKLQERWDELKRLSESTRERINSSIEYFRLLEEAKNWYRDGNKLMIVIARKSSSAKTPEEVQECLTGIDGYLKPGEELQEQRVEKIRDLSTRIFGTDRLPQFNEVVVENRETLDSFAVITSELRTLAQNLKNSADIFEEKKREKEEELRKLNAARAEAQAAYEAEIERKKVETMMEEKKKQEHALKSSVFAQTEEEQKVVEETVTSAVTTKEIIILQKTEVEEDLPVLMPYVYNPPEESTKDIKKETQELVLPEPPKFIVPLNDSTIEEGNRFIFQCKLEHGKPKPEIIWYKDGVSILNNPDYLTSYDEETGQCILTIEETFAEDSARFMCKAFNTAGFAETGATLKIKETAPEQQLSPPTFIKELLGSVAKKGSPHFLSCRVTGNPLPTVQWFKDNTNIEDSSPDYAITYNNGEALLKFIEVLPDDSGVYTCKATNKLGQASTSANLLVKAEIDEKKTVEVIQSNGISSSTPELQEESDKIISKVSFIKEQKIIQESQIIKIESHTEEMGGSVSHIIPDASAQEITTSVNQEEIVVPVKVQTGVVKSPEMPELFEVPELIKPSVQLPLKDVQVFEGNTVRLDCVIIGQPEPEVIWYHDEQPVKESADFQLLFQGDRCSLIIHEAFLDDAGKYKVVAINSQGEISSECVLSVIPSSEAAKQSTVSTAPQFVKLIADVLVSEGEDAVFECQVTGEPKPDLRWYFNNEEIVFVHERITMTHDKTGNCTLKICSTTAEDKGNYVAKAINLIGEAKAIARLVVKPASNESFKREELIPMEEKLVAPSFEEIFEDKRVVLPGVSTKFECIVHGKPTPKIQWMFNEKPVHGKSFLVSVSGDRQVLTIPETNQEHVGFISCVAENTKGKATCTTQLDVKGTGGGGEETKATAAKGVEDAKDYFSPLGDEMQASNSSESHLITERKTLPSDQVDESVLTKMSSSYTQSSTTQSSCTKEFKSSTTSSSVIAEPQFRPAPGNVVTKTHVESREYSSQENGGPPVVQSHKVEEYEKIVQDSPGQLRQEKTKIVTEGNVSLKMQKPARKNVAPRFVSPLTGMIVDQGHDVVLEGVIDGFPTPVITWMKNGQDVKDGVKTTFEHNHVRLELKNVNVRDAGRYTCTAVNDIGNASSTADLVVKKTIFPPVFGKRLQAQVVKKGERVIMEVEITGTPEPTVTWYKDDEPLIDVDGQLKQIGNCYLLIIDAAEKRHAGKYMVHASNAGGEGQSIADFAVFEPTPDTMVEVHKTIVYENVADKNLKLEEKKSELPSAALTAEHIATTTIQPSSTLKTLNPTPSSTSSKIRKIELIGPKSNQHTEEIVEKATRSEMISSTIESHQSETKSEQKFHMKLQHQAPSLFEGDSNTPAGPTVTTTTTKISTHETQKGGEPVTTRTTEFVESKTLEKEAEENENVETATIAKKDALSFFESMSKDSEMTPKGPKAMIKLTEEDKDGNYDVKVDKLTKNYERSTKFEEVKKPIIETSTPTKKSVQDISHKFEAPIITKGVDNVMIDFPYDDYKLPALNIQRAVLEDTTASGSPIHGTLTISRLVAQSESAEKMLSGFNLVPEPPPEIGYMPKPDEEVKKGMDVSSKAKQLQEFQKKSVDAPIGGVKIFPTANAPPKTPQIPETKLKTTYIAPPFDLSEKESKEFCKKEVVEERCIKKDVHKKEEQEKWWSSTSDLETRSHISTDLSDYRCQSGASSQFEGRPSSPKPSADGIAMEKYWAKSKTTEANRKSWPPQATAGKETTKTFTKREEWKEPEVGYKTSTHENRDEVEEIPGGGVTKTHIESTSSLETRSWSTRENQISQTVIEEPPKNIVKPKVAAPAPKPAPAPNHAPVTMYKAETTKVDHIVNSMQEKSIMEKYSSECEVKKMESMEKKYEELKAPGLVKAVPGKPVVQLYHSPGDNIKSEPLKTFQESASMFKGTLATAPKRPVVQLYHPTGEPEIILEPGPPPEIGYAPPPNESYERKFEMHSYKKEDAPPIPPKDARKTPPPLPAKKTEPFSCGNFARGQFIESDYESDFESCRKWRPCESESEEKKYRRVQPPTPRQPRPRSTEPGPPPPSSFEVPPPEVTGPPRPDYLTESLSSCKKSSTMMSRQERSAKQQQHYQNQGFSQDNSGVNLPKPGSPPVYVTPEPPKCKSRVFQQESGYMADTDEPFYQREACSLVQKTCGKNEGSSMSSYESKQFMESKSYVSSSSNQRREEMNYVSCPGQTSSCNAQTQQRIYEKSYIPTAPNNNSRCFKNDKEETSYSWSQNQKSSATSPSKFARGEFRESDYESDYEGRIPPLWKPRSESDFEEHHSYKSVKSNLSESPWPNSNGNSGQKEIIQPYLDILPKKAPLFITPLRDIAVVSGQTARFECIVQAEPQPNILWSKDGRIVENSHNYEVYYRNGVCRLVIPCACPSDAGTYVCTATNSLGSTATSSSLQVPGNRRSIYGTK
ncbi:uncharacterized protein LOC123267682 isoform X4 [Cotesia glomerata]|uniref:uncharacterized protein LOC123267682 isoform X4 n=1 Tax=Cotesia glomerata TaxID=32391 RepID=UPI001D006836|nr:uncharacterized protein LOC123267682 isoform X4 [Cotesia glomerata]